MIKQVNVRMDPEMHRDLSLVSVLQMKSMQALILDAISDRLERDWGAELRRYRAKGEEKK